MATALALRIQFGQGLVFAHPRPEELVGDGDLPGFVEQLDHDVLTEVLERNLAAQALVDQPDLIGPALEFDIVGDATFERDRLVLGTAGRLALGAGVTAVTVLHHFGGALQWADLTDTGDDASVPEHEELEVLVRVEPRWINSEFGH